MNARIAIKENKRITLDFFNEIKEFSERTGKSLNETLEFKLALRMKWAKNDNEKAAWDLRAKEVEEMINSLVFETEKELKLFIQENREKVTKINDVEFGELYPILEVSNKHASYYDVESQGSKFLYAPFKVTIKK